MGTFVCGEATCEAYDEGVLIKVLNGIQDEARAFGTVLHILGYLHLEELYKIMFQLLTYAPYHLVLYIFYLLPHSRVRLVIDIVLAKDLRVQSLPVSVSPCREVHSVSNIADMVFFREVSRPHFLEHLTAHPPVNPTHAVDFLAKVCSEDAHREFLVRVFFTNTSEAHEVFP